MHEPASKPLLTADAATGAAAGPGADTGPSGAAGPAQNRFRSVERCSLGWAGLGRAGLGLVWDTGEMEIAWCVGMPGHVTTCLMHAA